MSRTITVKGEVSRALTDTEIRQMKIRRNRIRRERQLRRRMIIAAAALVIIIFSSLGLTSFLSDASEETSSNVSKVYTSVMVPYGSSLYEMASDHMDPDYYSDIDSYIKEVRFINHLSGDEIKAGNYLVIPVYKELY